MPDCPLATLVKEADCDRIDELVAICTKQMNACSGCPNLLAITELATIARGAEAMCEWLVDIAASHAVAANLLREDETRDEYKARLLKAASEAVKS